MAQNKYSYNVLLQRIDEEGLTVQLVDRDLTADDAINLMLHIQEEIPAIEEETSLANEREEEMDETTAQDKLNGAKEVKVFVKEKKLKKGTVPSNSSWDKEKAKAMILKGVKPAKIAEAVGATLASVYQLKSNLKHKGELLQKETEEDHSDTKRGKTVTDEPEAKQPREEHTRPTLTTLYEDPQKKAIFRRLPEAEKSAVHEFQEGAGVSEIFRNNPSVGVHRINHLINEYGKIKLN